MSIQAYNYINFLTFFFCEKFLIKVLHKLSAYSIYYMDYFISSIILGMTGLNCGYTLNTKYMHLYSKLDRYYLFNLILYKNT